MSDYPENLERMMTVWNTKDSAEKAKLVETALEHNIHFVDPKYNIIGRQAFLDMVDATQAEFPGASYHRDGQVEGHNNHYRYHWAVRMGDQTVMKGFDVTEVNDAGKVVKVMGFFGELER